MSVCSESDSSEGVIVRVKVVLLQDDRRMNLQGRAATKKLVMLPTVLSHLKK